MKTCKICGGEVKRSRTESNSQYERKLCCGKKCRDIAQSITSKGIRRSPKTEIKKGERLSPRTEFRTKKDKKYNNYGYELAYQKFHPFCMNHGYVFKHRLIMEKHLGRYLRKTEVVHHIDGNKKNNKLNNLILFPSSSAHSKYHQMLNKQKLNK